MDLSKLSHSASIVISVFERGKESADGKKISVNPAVSKIASWYEKLRNAMDYREEEVVLRAAIERILKRRILLGGIGKTIAEPLIRELVWARYFPNDSLPETLIHSVEEKIDLYLELRRQVLISKTINDNVLNDWIIHLLSSSIEKLLNPNKEKEVMSNLMYQIMRENISIPDDTEEVRDAQVFIAVRKSFARDDLAFLRYNLVSQFFGDLTKGNVDHVASKFKSAYDEIERQFNYVRKDSIFTYVKGKTAAFYILDGLLREFNGRVGNLLKDEEELRKVIYDTCDRQYEGITSRVRRAIIRSVFFIILTKVIFAFAVEGTFEKFMYGKIMWSSIILNTTIPPLLMIIVGFTIRAPGRNNSERIFKYIKKVLYEDHPHLGDPLVVYKNPKKTNATLYFIFTILWVLAFIVSFGAVIYILGKLQFTFISKAIFIFFLAIVSFLSYRIALVPRAYTVEEEQGFITPLIDFFFMPVIRVGRSLTEGIQQINVLLFLFDFIIEAPFKGLFAFFEQWFHFLHTKREELG